VSPVREVERNGDEMPRNGNRPFAWNSKAKAWPMPPGVHLHHCDSVFVSSPFTIRGFVVAQKRLKRQFTP